MSFNGDVRINTGMNLDGLKKGIKDTEKELSSMQKRMNSSLKATVDIDSSSVSDLGSELSDVGDKMKEIKDTAQSVIFSPTADTGALQDLLDFKKQMEGQLAESPELLDYYAIITDEQEKQINAILEQRKATEELTASIDKAQNAQERFSSTIKSTTYDVQEIEKHISDFTGEIDGIDTESAERVKSSFNGIASAAQTAAKLAISGFKKAAVVIGTFAKGAARASRGILGMTKNVLGFGRGTRNASKGVAGLANRIGRLALAALVFNQIRKALRSLTTALGNVLMANADFARSFNAIKVNMLTAFAPIWEVIQPAIITFMQLLARFTAVLARFMATLFGKTYQQAKDSAAAIYDQAKATDKLGASASKAGKQLASFDEINKQAEDSAGGGAGAEAWDFNIEEPENSWLSWLDEFAAKLKNIFTEIDPEYWFDLGAKLAAWITNALNSIPWDTVQTWARNFATNLAAFLNGFLGDTAMWQAIGHTIAQGLNTVLIFLYTMLTELDFYKIASAIGEGINTFLDEFNWDLLAGTIKAGIMGAINTLNGLLDTIKWADIGTKFATLLNDAFADKDMGEKLGATLAKGINAAVAVLLNFVQTFNWKEHAATLAASINKFIEDTNWDDVGRLVGEFFKGALDYLNTAIAETDWDKLGESIGTFLTAIDWPGIFDKLLGIIGKMLASNNGIWNGLARGFSDGLATALGIESDGIGMRIIEGLESGLKAGFATLNPIYAFTNFINEIKKLFGIASPSKLFTDFGLFIMQGFFNGISSLVSAVIGIFQKLWTSIQNVWSAVSGWFDKNVIIPVRTAFETATSKIRDFFNNLWEKIKYIWNVAASWFSTYVLDPLKTAFDNALKAVFTFFSNLWTNIQGVWKVVSAWFDTNVIQPIKMAFDSGLKAVFDFFKNAWSNIQGIWTGAKSWFENTVTTPIKNAFDTATTAIKNLFSGLWDFVSGIFGKIGNLISDILDGISDVNSSANSAGKSASGISSKSNVSASNYSLEGMDIPMLARGGIVDSATLAVIGERGREAVVPLENNAGWIRSIAQEIAAEMMSAMSPLQQSQQATVVLEVDGRTFGRAVVDLGSAEKSRMGVRIQPTGAFI